MVVADNLSIVYAGPDCQIFTGFIARFEESYNCSNITVECCDLISLFSVIKNDLPAILVYDLSELDDDSYCVEFLDGIVERSLASGKPTISIACISGNECAIQYALTHNYEKSPFNANYSKPYDFVSLTHLFYRLIGHQN